MSLWGRKSASFPAIEIRPRSALPPAALVRDTDTASALPGSSTSLPIPSSAAGNNPVPSTGPAPPSIATAKPRRYKCSLCSSAFARAEHLARHERSHRNERPFACKHCDARFTRKDLIKRHVQRHHGLLTGVESEESLQVTARGEANSPEGSEIVVTTSSPSIITTPSETHGQSSLDAADNFGHDNTEMGPRRQTSGEPAEVLSAPLPFSMDAFMTLDFGTTNGSLSHECPSDLLPRSHGRLLRTQSCCASRFTPAAELEGGQPSLTDLQRSSKIGSREVSVSKRAELVREIAQVSHLYGKTCNFELLSCTILEGCLTLCIRSFLCHVPCIHIPTWRAEDAHPTLLLSMIAVGLIYQMRRELANDIYRAARLSIIHHLESLTCIKESPPVWVMQAILLIMAYGTWAGDPSLFQDGIALQSRLAHMVRSASPPEAHETEETAYLSSSWEEWVRLETFRRTIFAVYSYFSILSLSSNIPPALLSSEIDLPLPCPEREWTAATPTTWAECHKSGQKPEPIFLMAIRNLSSPNDLPLGIANSEAGGYVVLHALLQQLWHIRQASAELATVEMALERWQVMWMPVLRESVSSSTSYIPVGTNAYVLLRLAYMRLAVDFPCLRAALTSQNISSIAHAMASPLRDLSRCPASMKAASYAIDALRVPLKLGLHLPTKGGGALTWSVEHHLFSMECCLFLSKWLSVLTASTDPPWTIDEESLVILVQETVEDVGLDTPKLASPLNAQVMYAWAAIYGSRESWGIVSTVTASVLCFADNIAPVS